MLRSKQNFELMLVCCIALARHQLYLVFMSVCHLHVQGQRHFFSFFISPPRYFSTFRHVLPGPCIRFAVKMPHFQEKHTCSALSHQGVGCGCARNQFAVFAELEARQARMSKSRLLSKPLCERTSVAAVPRRMAAQPKHVNPCAELA